MARQIIDTGTLALNGKDGDTNRDAAEKSNANFQELYGQQENFVRGAGVVPGGALVVFAGTTGNQVAAAAGGAPGTAAFANVTQFATAAQGTKADNSEPAIAAGTDAQYWTGLKTWANFAQTVLSTLLQGYQVGSNAVITATDSFLQALGKLQGQVTARALKGENSDITSLSGLTTALSVAQGGTGSGTPAGARTNLGVDVTLATAQNDPQTAGGLMSSTVVSGYKICKFVNGLVRIQGSAPNTPQAPSNGIVNVIVTIPSVIVDTGAASITVNLSPFSNSDQYGAVGAEMTSNTTAYFTVKNGPTAQIFGVKIEIWGTWK